MNNKVIKIKIEDEKDIYNRFDSSRNTLSEEVLEYITSELQTCESKANVHVEVESDKEIDIYNFNKALDNYCSKEIDKIDKKIRFNRVKMFLLITVGIIFVTLSVVLHNIIHEILTTIIATIGSFTFWEALDILILGNNELKIDKHKFMKLYDVEILNERK